MVFWSLVNIYLFLLHSVTSCPNSREVGYSYPQMKKLQVERLRLSLVTQHDNNRSCVMETEVLVFLEENPFLSTLT